jgi:hypothetical protein
VPLLGGGGRGTAAGSAHHHDAERKVCPPHQQTLAEWDTTAAEVQERFREILGSDTELFHDLLRRLSTDLKVDAPADQQNSLRGW